MKKLGSHLTDIIGKNSSPRAYNPNCVLMVLLNYSEWLVENGVSLNEESYLQEKIILSGFTRGFIHSGHTFEVSKCIILNHLQECLPTEFTSRTISESEY